MAVGGSVAAGALGAACQAWLPVLPLTAALNLLLLLLLPPPPAAANSYTPPLQLHPCAASQPASQRWAIGRNGSVFSMDRAGHIGYCIDILDNSTAKGATVQAANCGRSGASDPTAGANQLWAVKGSSLASQQPATPFCLGVAPGASNGQLTSCSNSSAQFAIPTGGGRIVHKGSGLCLTVVRCFPFAPRAVC